jgi:peptidoglycan biosynthesis protein MviN/MurJ (putative lipid II flippase)
MLTVLGLFATGLIGVALMSYLGPGGGELFASLGTGLGCGLLLALLGWRAMRGGVDAVTRPVRPLTVFNVLLAGAGIAVIARGTITFDWPLALAGLPLLALGVGLMVARRLLNRTKSTD